MHPVDYYSTFTKNCSSAFTEEEVRGIRAFYYAMCAEADAMLGEPTAVIHWGAILNEREVLGLTAVSERNPGLPETQRWLTFKQNSAAKIMKQTKPASSSFFVQAHRSKRAL